MKNKKQLISLTQQYEMVCNVVKLQGPIRLISLQPLYFFQLRGSFAFTFSILNENMPNYTRFIQLNSLFD